MPGIYIGDKFHHYYEHLSDAERNQLLRGDKVGALQDATEKMWRDHCYQNVHELVDRLKDSGQFSEEISGLLGEEADAQAACADNDIYLSDQRWPFHFNYDDLSTVECDGPDKCMIDFRAFAESIGIELNKFEYDPDAEVELQRLPDGVEGDALADFFKHANFPDGQDVFDFLKEVADEQGIDAAVWEKSNRALLEAYVDDDYISSQSHADLDECARDACETYGIDLDPIEFYEHYAVDEQMARALKKQGETVVEFMGFDVWCRGTTGQSVALDHCVQSALIESFPYEADALIEASLPEAAQRIKNELEAARVAEFEAKMKLRPSVDAPAP